MAKAAIIAKLDAAALVRKFRCNPAQNLLRIGERCWYNLLCHTSSSSLEAGQETRRSGWSSDESHHAHRRNSSSEQRGSAMANSAFAFVLTAIAAVAASARSRVEARANALPSLCTAARTTSSSSPNVGAYFNDHPDNLTAASTHSLSVQIEGGAFFKVVCPLVNFPRTSIHSALRTNRTKSTQEPATIWPRTVSLDTTKPS